MQVGWSWLLSAMAQIGADPIDPDDGRLRKSLLIFSTALTGLAGILWGTLYLVLSEPLAASIPLSYTILCGLSTLMFGFTRRLEPYRFRQLLLILFLPFLLMLSLSSFVTSGAVILWSLLSPLGALLLSRPPPPWPGLWPTWA